MLGNGFRRIDLGEMTMLLWISFRLKPSQQHGPILKKAGKMEGYERIWIWQKTVRPQKNDFRGMGMKNNQFIPIPFSSAFFGSSAKKRDTSFMRIALCFCSLLTWV